MNEMKWTIGWCSEQEKEMKLNEMLYGFDCFRKKRAERKETEIFRRNKKSEKKWEIHL